jgi:hypothetical protein
LKNWEASLQFFGAFLQNNDRVLCSFGTTKTNDAGFWKANANIPVTVTYEGWFGNTYTEKQGICVADSNSFTSYSWGMPS